MNILAIETSCDETSAAVLAEENGKPVLLSNIVSSQIDLHKEFGGVVPEVAARAHIESIIPVIKNAIAHLGGERSPHPRGERSQQLHNPYSKIDHKKAMAVGWYKKALKEIDYIAVTYGPGLVGSLVVGVETAKGLGLALGKPVFPVNHLEGHVYANFIRNKVKSKNEKLKTNEPQFPIVALLVSGGHTMLIYMKDHLKYKVIGETRDDAAGEAFDKGARVLGLGYPGGPAILKAAEKGDATKYNFPIIDLTEPPKRGTDGFLKYPKPSLDFSFSGLKTALITQTKKSKPKTQKDISDLSASFQKAIVDTLVQNSLRAVEQYKPKTFILSGGVAANKLLRDSLESSLKKSSPCPLFLVPSPYLCTDNAGMIAAAAYFHIKIMTNDQRQTTSFSAEPNLRL